MVYSDKISLSTDGFSDIKNITEEVQDIVYKSGIKSGIVAISSVGSTASVTTIEFESALVEDMRDLLESIAPHTMKTRHGDTWGDDNGFSHLRASLMGPGISAPFSDGKLILGTWQQIVVIDHDNRSRHREIFVQIVGE